MIRELRQLREFSKAFTGKIIMDALLYPQLGYAVVGAAMEVHRELGPGFPEQIYQKALEVELRLRNIPFVAQKRILVRYKNVELAEYFLDLVVDEKICGELKAVSRLAGVHKAQVLTYLKASDLKLGILINFGEASLAHRRFALSKKKN